MSILCTLGEMSGGADALAKVAMQHIGDRWFRTAVLSSIHDAPVQFFERVISKKELANDGDLVAQLAFPERASSCPAHGARFAQTGPSRTSRRTRTMRSRLGRTVLALAMYASFDHRLANRRRIRATSTISTITTPSTLKRVDLAFNRSRLPLPFGVKV